MAGDASLMTRKRRRYAVFLAGWSIRFSLLTHGASMRRLLAGHLMPWLRRDSLQMARLASRHAFHDIADYRRR